MSRLISIVTASALVIALCGALPAWSAEMVLADRGRTDYTIVHAADATEAEQLAVTELASYLAMVTGASFPVQTDEGWRRSGPCIIVGPCGPARELLGAEAVAALAGEELVVRTLPRAGTATGTMPDLLLVGGRPRGTLYAVYSFLEREVGCRWLSVYGEEHVPQRQTLRLGPCSHSESPAFEMRDIYTLGYSAPRQRGDFMRRSRVNGDPIGGTDHSMISPGVHTLFYYINPSDKPDPGYGEVPHPATNNYFKTNPEFFSLMGGQRVPRQLCFSNPALRRELTANIEERIRQAGAVGNLSVSAEDVPGEFCECPDCRRLVEAQQTPGAPLFDYLVELGEYLKPKYPRVFITTLAYRKDQSEIPPATLTLPDNIIVVFAPIDDNFAASLEHPSNAATRKHLEQWKRCAKHVWVWYYTNPYGSAGLLPIGNLGRLAADMRLFHRVGVSGFFIEHDAGVGECHGLTDLQTWVLAKLLWDPDQNLADLVRGFTDLYYGPAAGALHSYVSLLEERTRAMPTAMPWSPSAGEYRLLTPAVLATSQRLFDKAEGAVAKDPVLLLRVRQARMSLDRASILFWRKLAALPNSGLSRETIASRYRETYHRTLEDRIQPVFRDRLAGYVDGFLDTHLRLTEPKPLPPPLGALPPDGACQVFAVEGATPDPDAAVGMARSLDTGGELPLTLGYYDALKRAFVMDTAIQREQITSGGYALYRLGRAKLSEQGLVWITRSWQIQVSLSECYDPAHPDGEWEVYVSLRFEGPSYPHGERGTVDRVFVDRVVVVPAAR